MSDSDDAYGPALPPGLTPEKSDDKFGPALPPAQVSQQPAIGPVLPPGVKLDTHQTSDSDLDSSSSSSDNCSKRKRKTRRKSESSSSDDHVQRNKHRKRKRSSSGSSSDEDTATKKNAHTKQRQIIGPVIPGASVSRIPSTQGILNKSSDESDDDDNIGPSIGLIAGENDLSAAKEFEARAEKMKERLSGKTDGDGTEPERETWMTELPEDMGATLGTLGLGNRQFRKNAALTKDQSWTDTPTNKGDKKKDGKKKKHDRDAYFKSGEEKKASKEIEEYNKKFRKDSLMDMHKKDLKKKKKKEEKKRKKKKEKKERVAFDRERDLKVNRLDEAQKKAFIKRSQELGGRFKSGGTGTSFL